MRVQLQEISKQYKKQLAKLAAEVKLQQISKQKKRTAEFRAKSRMEPVLGGRRKALDFTLE